MTKSTLVPSLVASIRAGDVDGVLARAVTLEEADRVLAAPGILEVFDAAHGLIFGRDSSVAYERLGLAEPEGDDRQQASDILCAAQTALLAVLQDVEKVRKYAWRSIPPHDRVMQVLASRERGWNLAWSTLVCEIAPTRWHTARALVRAGLSARPETDGYVLGMIWAATLVPGRAPARGVGARTRPLFEEEPELLDDDVWRVFEVEGNRDISLTSHERFWHDSLIEWSRTGRLDRGRMLDATLGALSRDFPQHKAGFYSRLHDDLAPTVAEITARASTYIDLLASRISPTVSLATRAVNLLGDGVDTGALARAATSAGRMARGQSTALTLLRLLAKARDPEALLAVTAFLEHESVDVVDAALATLESCAVTPELVGRVVVVAPAIAASRRARVNAWLASHGAEVAPATAAEVAPRRTEPPREVSASARARARIDELARTAPDAPWPRVTLDEPAPRLDPALALAPVASAEDLFEVLARALEEPTDRVTFERMLDGVSRLGAPRDALPTDQTRPLAKRAATLVARGGAATLVHAWLTGRHAHRSSWASTDRFGDRRIANVAERLHRGETRPLLALPSTSNFFLDPRVLVARVRAQGAAAIDVEDAVTAFLRLAPEHHEEALTDLADAKGPLAAALRHALGGESTPDAQHPALWIAAARVRASGGDDPGVLAAFPDAGPDAGAAAKISYAWTRIESSDRRSSWARFTVTMTPEAAPVAEHFSVLLATKGHAGNGAQFGIEGGVREIASVWPGDRRTFFAWGTERITRNVDWSSAEWANHVFLEPLLDPDVPLDEHGLMLLAIALNTKEARENALATDALVLAITDGRVVGPELAAPLAFHWHSLHEEVTYSHRATASRWAKTFTQVARASVLHAEVVRRILEAFFAAPPAVPPPDVHALLQLWLDLATEAATGVPEAARAAVGRIGKSGKAKKIATRLLALAQGPSAHAAEAHALALAGRWQRAERWAWSRSSGGVRRDGPW